MSQVISLARGHLTIVDDADLPIVTQHRWSFDGKYVSRKIHGQNGRKLYLHRELMGATVGQKVDHINGNPLDNRRENLRLATAQQNAFNARAKSGTSRFKGVSWDKRSRKWAAIIMINGRNHRLGRFQDEAEAALAYNRAAIELHGEYARLNEVTL